MKICCYGCNHKNINAFLVTGREVLPKEKHLKNKFFWKCPNCRNFVGTRKVGDDDIAPTGAIATKKIREIQGKLRSEIYAILELKKSTPNAKQLLYDWLSKKLFYRYRTSAVMSQSEADKVRGLLKLIKEKS